MASRREQTRREEGFYGRLHRFSTADEWNILRPRSVVRKRKSEVFEVEFILGERKRKEVREFLVKWSGWRSEFSSWEPEEHFLNPAIIRDKGEQCSRGTWAFNKEDFSLCKFPRGWDRAWVNARRTERELLFPVLLRPFLSRSTQLYHVDGSKRQRRWTQRLSISFRKHTV